MLFDYSDDVLRDELAGTWSEICALCVIAEEIGPQRSPMLGVVEAQTLELWDRCGELAEEVARRRAAGSR
jgi:hypothetical protein